ncbi:MAG: hypothetical protein A2045_06445 [Rhodocyclales bacterium GWA2_65_20]|nr:MAG: hypothetical protein A2045_06445 [Rhodocyclales bacterium GWA2_65_20]
MNTGLNARYGAIEGKKQALVRDLKSVVADADGLLKEVVSSTADEYAAARTKVDAKLGETRSRLAEARLAAAKKARDAADAADEYVKENPWKILGATAAAGLIAGIFLTRR